MSEPEPEALRLEVEVYGLTFRLRAPLEDHDRLRRSARHVDNVMRELVVSQTTPDTTRLAIQAAFMITLDYIKLMDDIANETGATDENKKRVDQLLERLEESLKSL
jgi:cell division protein ZapA (FtsZ GTPase activity inhibitor)